MKPPSETDPPSLPLSVEERIDAVCLRFEQSWKAGQAPRLEQFLEGVAAGEREALLRELLQLEVEYRLGKGERPSAEEYLQRFPGQEAVVREVVETDLPGGARITSEPTILGPAGTALQIAATKFTLTVIAGPHVGQTFTFDRYDRFLVGRSEQAHFRLLPDKDKDLLVSRLHFLVEVNPPVCRLLDLNSQNGTFVNEQRVTSCDLKHGDVIRAGQTVLRVSAAEEPLAPTVAWLGAGTLGLPAPPNRGAGAPPAKLAAGKPLAPRPVGSLCPGCSRNPLPSGEVICAGCRERGGREPQPIPGYLLLRELGRGGMGVVYLGQRQADNTLVAVKTILPQGVARPELIQRFLREADILRELEHPRIVSFREIGSADNLLWFAMDYVAGTDAAALLKVRGPLPVPMAVRIVLQVLKGLEYAHGKTFVHRDVKPANVLLETKGPRLRVKVVDFGLGRLYQESRLSGLTLEHEMGGTLEFMAPEQITHFREARPSADQFAAAATLYNLLTGRFIQDLNGPLATRVDRRLREDSVPLRDRRADLPEKLAAVVHRALEREPQRRYADVGQFWKALRPFA